MNAPREPAGMVWVPGRTFAMGSDEHHPEEAPVHDVTVAGFWMDRFTVRNRDFARFVCDTGYVTVAERPRPGPGHELREPASLVFVQPRHMVDLDDPRSWWHSVAEAYARWAGRQTPDEAEWELAARGGLERAVYAWGDELTPGGRYMANTWQGRFPYQNTAADGFAGTAPVGRYPPNGYGLYDMIGNVWEWTSDWYGPGFARKVVKGGSYLCAPNHCRHCRPAARKGHPVDTGTCHLGLRLMLRPDQRPGPAARAGGAG